MKKKISHKTIAKRITSINIGPFGIGWTPSKDKRDIIRKLLVFLEDRRVLFASYEMEFDQHVIQSILEIRKELTETLKECSEDDLTFVLVRRMRAACRKFLQDHDNSKPRIYGICGEVELGIHLGELRAAMGIAISQLCVAYQIDVEPELATIFPVADTK